MAEKKRDAVKVTFRQDEYIDGQRIADRLGLEYADEIFDEDDEQEELDVTVERYE